MHRPGRAIRYQFSTRSVSENPVVGPRASGFLTGKDGEAGDIGVYRRYSRTQSSPKTSRSKPDRILRQAPKPRESEHTQGNTFTVVVARDASDVYSFLAVFRWLLLSCSVGIVLLSGTVSAQVTKIGLRPVHSLAREIRSVDEEALRPLFTLDAYPAELTPICTCLNELMERIKRSFTRERRFNADVAHELRTPLAGLQSTIEVCLARPRKAQDYQAALTNCLAISQAMSRLVNTLLALSRLETNQIHLNRQSLSLKRQIEKTWQSFADQAHDKQLTYHNQIPDSLCCYTDQDHFTMILTNMLDNAVDNCNTGGQITVQARSNDQGITLSLSNTGCRLNPADADLVYDVFWRGDSARTGKGTHCGIGLTLVQKVA
jgi:two-component system, OmpR family, heavy metal sensor histidine kinase CusS